MLVVFNQWCFWIMDGDSDENECLVLYCVGDVECEGEVLRNVVAFHHAGLAVKMEGPGKVILSSYE